LIAFPHSAPFFLSFVSNILSWSHFLHDDDEYRLSSLSNKNRNLVDRQASRWSHLASAHGKTRRCSFDLTAAIGQKAFPPHSFGSPEFSLGWAGSGSPSLQRFLLPTHAEQLHTQSAKHTAWGARKEHIHTHTYPALFLLPTWE
jgi:hypothetical protein